MPKLEINTYLRNQYGTWWRVTAVKSESKDAMLVGYAEYVGGNNNVGGGIYINHFNPNFLVVCNTLVTVFTEFEYLLLKSAEYETEA